MAAVAVPPIVSLARGRAGREHGRHARGADPATGPAGLGGVAGMVVFNLGWLVAGWADLAGSATRFGLLLAAVLVAYAALEGKPGGGYLQRAAILLVSAGVVVLAVRVRALCQRLPIRVRQEHA
jgi:hypothetical protein